MTCVRRRPAGKRRKMAEGKVAAVTGAAHGIGAAVARRFAREGYAVSLADGDEAAGAAVAAELRAAGGRVLFVPTDVGDAAAVRAWMDATVRELGCPDVLVNDAGINRNGPFLELTPEDFDLVLGVNLRGTFLCTQAAARQMVAHGRHGAVINIASTRAFMSEPDTEAYSASKGGIIALTHATAMSLAEHRIRVNSISPGWIETRMAPVHSERDHLQHPVGRVGKPDDIADACVFLAESAGFMTGQNITLDGGMSVKMIYEETPSEQ